ncbi:unnamed protein product [Macrosiphum euphorbiae]|uniref:TTF-type domain-containing protein n=1 Tax=Macrosiphum euphorbiae TaxID=13131 RepID=A0AAV0XDR2_9HEMI|nr:unnamed protein product [Macrosiphum euphorbiae]
MNQKQRKYSVDLGDIDSGPKQPKLQIFPLTKFGPQNRSFNAKHYSEFEWLEYSVSRDAVFCFNCIHFAKNVKTDNLITTGYNNWRKLNEKLLKHSKTVQHLTSTVQYNSYKSSKLTGTIVTQLSTAKKNEILKNRQYMKVLINITLFCAKQGLALRGHDEKSSTVSNTGNFKELCTLFAMNDKEFSDFFNRKINYTSWIIQNSILEVCSNMTINTIISEIKYCGMYSIMCDEARSYKTEQLSICVRYIIPNSYNVCERFIGFYDVSNGRGAEHISIEILSVLKKFGISDIPLVAQTYDGANVMSGSTSGVQTRIRDSHPEAIFIHCMAHKLNLVVTNTCRTIKESNTFFNTLEAVYVHFSQPGKDKLLQDLQKSMQIKSLSISRLCETRWSCRLKNCKAVHNSFGVIVNILQNEINEDTNKEVAQAIGLLHMLKKMSFVLYLFIFEEILGIIDILSKKLQKKEGTIGNAVIEINAVIKTIQNMRNEKSFDVLWNNVIQFLLKHDIDDSHNTPGPGVIMSSKRKRKESIKLKSFHVSVTTGAGGNDICNQGVDMNRTENYKQYWCSHAYYAVLDAIIGHFELRFSKESLELANSIDNFIKLNMTKSMMFIDHYQALFSIDKEALRSEMTVAHNCAIQLKPNFGLEELKTIISKEVYPNIHSLLKVALILPISSASCERSFSAMRRIKNWTRTSMTQDRFGYLSVLHIERDIVNNLDLNIILDEYSKKDRRIDLIL